MKKILPVLIITAILALTLVFGAERMKVEEKETIQKTLAFQDPSKPKEVIVDNIFGAIEVEGTRGQEIQLTAYKTIKARNKDKIQKARQEVTLDITEEGNTIDLYVNGPFRCQNRNREWRDPGYQVHYEFKLKIPHKTDVVLKTVTDGDIQVTDIEGDFEVKNVNGKIEMSGMAGSGSAHTVNGRVRIQFNKNPTADCSFKTINGDIDIDFVKGLSADFRLKTFNGDALSDFPIDYLPARSAEKGRKGGKFIYKSDRFIGVRIDKGGPEIKMDTLNGDLLIKKR
jgi:hypothetical protein